MKRSLMVLMVLCGAQAVAGEPEVLIRVADEAGVPSKVMARATAQAGTIFTRIGLRVRWQTGGRVRFEAPTPMGASCGAPRRNLDTIDVVVKPTLTGKAGRQLAEALPFAADGSRVTIYYDRVGIGNLTGDQQPVALFAHVLAHEIGHVLLGTNGHARSGVMRANWTRADYGTMMYDSLAFTAEDAERIQRNMAGESIQRNCGPALVAAAGTEPVR